MNSKTPPVSTALLRAFREVSLAPARVQRPGRYLVLVGRKGLRCLSMMLQTVETSPAGK